MKIKLLFFLTLLFIIYTVFGNQTTQKLYYYDSDNNSKIDTIFIDFGEEIYGDLNSDKIFLYSNTGGLSSSIIDSQNLFLNYEIYNNILKLNFNEKDLDKTSLNITNTTNSDLRLKTNSGVGIFLKNTNEEIKILYTSSFDSYKNIYYGNPIDENNSNTQNQEENSSSQETQTNSGIILEEPPIYNEDQTNYNFELTFQNPSYILEKDLIKDKYFCDNSKTDCRVNFNLGIINNGIFQDLNQNNFICKWDFGPEIALQEIDKCNPNTITFLDIENNIYFEIFDKNNNKLYEKSILIIKNLQENQTNYGEILDENTSSQETQTNSGITLEEPPIYNEDQTNYNFELIFQNPSYILEKELIKDEYFCDNSKTDCRINLDIQKIENEQKSSISTSIFSCKISLNSQDYSQEIDKCNPTTLVLPIGEISLKYQIFLNQNNQEIFSKNITIKNSGYQKPTQSYTYSSKNYDIITTQKEIESPIIKVQSGLDNNNFCLKTDCTINLIYENNDKDILCEWDFGDIDFKFGDHNKCNPGYLKLNSKNHNIILKIYDKNNSFNYKTTNILIENNLLNQEFKNKDSTQKLPLNKDKNTDVQNIETIKISYLDKIFFNNILPNPLGKDKYEFIEIINNSDEDLDLNGCEIFENNSAKKYKLTKKINSKQVLKLYNYETKISLNNSKGFNLELKCFEEKIDEFMWTKKSFDNMILNKEILKYNVLELEKSDENILLKTNSGVISKPFYVDNPLLVLKNSDLDVLQKSELATEILNDNFTQKISKQKSGVKIYGKTIPNLKLVFTLEKYGNEFSFFPKVYADFMVFNTKSDINGNYEFFIKTPVLGNFKINNYVEITSDKSIELELKNELEVDSDYVEFIQSKNNNTQKISTDFKIVLQTKPGKNNKIENKKIKCLKTECSINFDVNIKSKDYKYLWNFGDGTTFLGTNPSFKKYKSGNYIVELEVFNDNFSLKDYFLVEVSFPKTKEISSKIETITKKESVENIGNIVVQKNYFFTKELILTLLIFFNFLLLSFLVLKNKKLI